MDSLHWRDYRSGNGDSCVLKHAFLKATDGFSSCGIEDLEAAWIFYSAKLLR